MISDWCYNGSRETVRPPVTECPCSSRATELDEKRLHVEDGDRRVLGVLLVEVERLPVVLDSRFLKALDLLSALKGGDSSVGNPASRLPRL